MDKSDMMLVPLLGWEYRMYKGGIFFMEWLSFIPTVITSFFSIILLVLGRRINSKLEKQKNDYHLYNEQRYIHYAETYRLLKIADLHVLRVYGESDSIRGFNDEDIKGYVKNFMPLGKVASVLVMWENKDFIEAEKLINKYKEAFDERIARQKIVDVENYLHQHELYFPNEFVELLKDYILGLYTYHARKKSTEPVNLDKLKDDLNTQIEEIKNVMKKELSIKK
ncbi:hypothetical protein [Bacillus safensis]|uniref:hypothetical protein n=1 Tax=Bacillus safensis TaxID=561879 RepID=UPI0018CE9072|nr:hypothetical protein [Bacillus safensis]